MSFDTNHDGQLSKFELVAGLEKLMRDKQEAEKLVDDIMSKVDINHNGTIDFTEFLIANTKVDEMLSCEKLQSAFNAFDMDGKGHITVGDIMHLLGTNNELVENSTWQYLIEEADLDGDGQISFEEFKNMMIKMYLAN